jgi:alanine racemase
MARHTTEPLSFALCQQAHAVVDLKVIANNYRILAAASGKAICAAVVKGDGYGLGMLPIARTCWEAGARLFFVARFDDGCIVRAELPQARIAVLDGLANWSPEKYGAERLEPVIGTPDDVRIWFAGSAPGPCMIQVDTGMNRLGLKPRELEGVAELIREHPKSVAAYLTHFASADDVDLAFCRAQVASFKAAIANLPKAPLTVVNSSGLFLAVPDWRQAITRPGKALYGINPMPPGEPSPVEQALTVTAPILQVSEIARGDSVGYSATFRATRPMRIATLGIGYANGYLRSLSNRGVVAFDAKRANLVGRVSMDLTTVDVTALPEAALAAGYAEMLGSTIGLTELAGLAGTNEYELQIALGRGCKRQYAAVAGL